jgi:hypothetical protein
MSHFDSTAAPQGRTGALQGRDFAPSVGATAQIGAPQRKSISFVGSASFCRPHS